MAALGLGCTGDNPDFNPDRRSGEASSEGGESSEEVGESSSEDTGELTCDDLEPGEAFDVELVPALGVECGDFRFLNGTLQWEADNRFSFECSAGCGQPGECAQGELVFRNFPPNIPDRVDCALLALGIGDDCMLDTLSITDNSENSRLIVQGGRAPTFLEPIHILSFGTSYEEVETCDCNAACCALNPGYYALNWTEFGSLEQGQSEVVEHQGESYELINMRSHVKSECAEPSFDWIIHPEF